MTGSAICNMTGECFFFGWEVYLLPKLSKTCNSSIYVFITCIEPCSSLLVSLLSNLLWNHFACIRLSTASKWVVITKIFTRWLQTKKIMRVIKILGLNCCRTWRSLFLILKTDFPWKRENSRIYCLCFRHECLISSRKSRNFHCLCHDTVVVVQEAFLSSQKFIFSDNSLVRITITSYSHSVMIHLQNPIFERRHLS